MRVKDPQSVLPEQASSRPGIKQEGMGFLDERIFNGMLERERKRNRRCGRSLILILVNLTGLTGAGLLGASVSLDRAFASRIRETDIRGWYLRNAVVGILYTDLLSAGSHTRDILFGKTMDALAAALGPDDLRKMYMTFHTFPADLGDAVPCGRFDAERYFDFEHTGTCARRSTRFETIFTRFCVCLGMKSCR